MLNGATATQFMPFSMKIDILHPVLRCLTFTVATEDMSPVATGGMSPNSEPETHAPMGHTGPWDPWDPWDHETHGTMGPWD